MTQKLKSDNITIEAGVSESESIQRLEKLLNSNSSLPCLVSNSGEQLMLPEPVYSALRQVVHAMAEGKAVSLVPSDRELSSQEAANILSVSRPYLVSKLLETGIIDFTMVGNRRRIRFQDVLAYKQQRDCERRRKINEFSEFLQDEGFYDG